MKLFVKKIGEQNIKGRQQGSKIKKGEWQMMKIIQRGVDTIFHISKSFLLMTEMIIYLWNLTYNGKGDRRKP